MATTAQVSISPTAAAPNQPLAVQVTVTNPSTSALTVQDIRLLVNPGSASSTVPANNTTSVACSGGKFPFGPGYTLTVAANGTATFYTNLIVFSPTVGWGEANPSTYQYSIGAIVSFTDGTFVVAQTTAVTAYTSVANLPASPSAGQFRFDDYRNAALAVSLGAG